MSKKWLVKIGIDEREYDSFDDEDKKYYFESNQVVRASSNPDDLGSVVFLNIYLTCKQ